ncbi:MAG: type IV pilus assembly protein PilM [Patescibacteria group bacterium]|nr:type IV pilus assembly protein PilM [Patescibacteria group bacterium]MDD5715720.1 type IV pilus assembly protein PilM [Patescibacteria group bacterium]
MPFFKNKLTSVLGVDLGTSSVKLVDLRGTAGKASLATYGIAELSRGGGTLTPYEKPEEIAEVIQDLISQAHASATATVGALSSLSVFTTVLSLPAMPEREIAQAIQWEARKLLPLPLEKMKLDWHILKPENSEAKKQQTMDIILTAAPTDVIERYLLIFKIAGLSLVGLETEAAAIGRSLLPPHGGNVLVIDTGATTTNLIVFSDNTPVVVRHSDIGGSTINHNIANALNVTIERAQQFKHTLGIQMSGEYTHPAARAIKFVIDNMIIQEVRRVAGAFNDMGRGVIDSIILTGGGSLLKNFPIYLQEILKIPVTIGNPWNKVSCPPGLAQELEYNKEAMAIAIGLGLKLF